MKHIITIILLFSYLFSSQQNFTISLSTINDTLFINTNSIYNIYGYQFSISNIDLSNCTDPTNTFTINYTNSNIFGYSLSGGYLESGSNTLMSCLVLDYDTEDSLGSCIIPYPNEEYIIISSTLTNPSIPIPSNEITVENCLFEDCKGNFTENPLILDICGVCDGGLTDLEDCEQCSDGIGLDCAGVCAGLAIIDECNICSGGDTGLLINESCLDCAGTPNGDAIYDCMGVCNGDAEIDLCGNCAGSCLAKPTIDCICSKEIISGEETIVCTGNCDPNEYNDPCFIWNSETWVDSDGGIDLYYDEGEEFYDANDNGLLDKGCYDCAGNHINDQTFDHGNIFRENNCPLSDTNYYCGNFFCTLSSNNTQIISNFKLNKAYPNPFNPSINFTVEVPAYGNLNINIYNIRGQKIKTLFDEYIGFGNYNYSWNATNYPNGIYFIKARFNDDVHFQKLTLIK